MRSARKWTVMSGRLPVRASSASATAEGTPLAISTNSVSLNKAASASPQLVSAAASGGVSSTTMTTLTEPALAPADGIASGPVMMSQHIQQVIDVVDLGAEYRDHPPAHRR